jgi:hypothetical protein
MKTRRNIIKAATGAITATVIGVPCGLHARSQSVQPILQNILQTQTFPNPVGLSFLLRYKDGAFPGDPLMLCIEKSVIETIGVRDFNEFDRKEFRKILQTVANTKSHELTSLNILSNRVAVYSRRGCANIFVCHPTDQKYVKDYFKNASHITVFTHPDVPRNYALAVYKGLNDWDSAGAFCHMEGKEKTRIGIWTPDVDKFMLLGRFK